MYENSCFSLPLFNSKWFNLDFRKLEKIYLCLGFIWNHQTWLKIFILNLSSELLYILKIYFKNKSQAEGCYFLKRYRNSFEFISLQEVFW